MDVLGRTPGETSPDVDNPTPHLGLPRLGGKGTQARQEVEDV